MLSALLKCFSVIHLDMPPAGLVCRIAGAKTAAGPVGDMRFRVAAIGGIFVDWPDEEGADVVVTARWVDRRGPPVPETPPTGCRTQSVYARELRQPTAERSAICIFNKPWTTVHRKPYVSRAQDVWKFAAPSTQRNNTHFTLFAHGRTRPSRCVGLK